VILRIACYSNLATIRSDEFALRHRVFTVVGAFGMNCRPKYIEHAPDIRFVEHHDMIHASKRGNKSCAFTFVENGTIGSFDRADRPITVNRHDKSIAEFSGSFEIADMPDVQNIDASVGENHGFTFQHSRQYFQLANFQRYSPS
jgi:hypothetical protein